jgi:prevent-host-death family protein
MVKHMVMKIVNIHEAKARLSEFVDAVEQGDVVLICRRNQPIAELRRVARRRSAPRPLGGTALDVPASFFEPLPAAEIDAFYGDGGSSASTAAEPRTTYKPARAPRRRRTKG